MFKKSLSATAFGLTALSAAAIATIPVAQAAQKDGIVVASADNPCNPCAAKKKNPCNPCNPCAAKKKNPCNPCNPCAAKKKMNPCNPCNPCAAKKNPCKAS